MWAFEIKWIDDKTIQGRQFLVIFDSMIDMNVNKYSFK